MIKRHVHNFNRRSGCVPLEEKEQHSIFDLWIFQEACVNRVLYNSH